MRAAMLDLVPRSSDWLPKRIRHTERTTGRRHNRTTYSRCLDQS